MRKKIIEKGLFINKVIKTDTKNNENSGRLFLTAPKRLFARDVMGRVKFLLNFKMTFANSPKCQRDCEGKEFTREKVVDKIKPVLLISTITHQKLIDSR